MSANEDRVARLQRLGHARDRIGLIDIDHPPQQEFRDALDEVRFTAARTRGRGQRLPGIGVFGHSYVGKSFETKRYLAAALAEDGRRPGTLPVARAVIDPEASLGSIATDLLRALGQPKPGLGTASSRWDRVHDALEECEVELLMIDEIQRVAQRPTVSSVALYKFQDWMESGLCSIALVGQDSLETLLRAVPDMPNRFDVPVRMRKLVWADATDREVFGEFARAYDDALKEVGALKVRSGFADDDENVRFLMEASNGLVGQFARIVETAVMSAARRDEPGITIADISNAVDDWSIGNARIGLNPFETDQPQQVERKQA